MIDWSKPLELMDGTPVELVATKELVGRSNPDIEGKYYLAPVVGGVFPEYGRFLIVEPSGIHWRRKGKVLVRNRAEQPNPTPETLTLRDQFAMAALTGIMAHDRDDEYAEEWVANRAYYLADAMLTARKGEG